MARRFIAVFYPPAQYEKTVRTTVVAGEQFRTTGKVLIEPGWLAVYGAEAEGDDGTPALCRVGEGEAVSNDNIDLKALQTKPPNRYTEATLLSAMENAGRLVNDEEIRAVMKTTVLGRPAIRGS